MAELDYSKLSRRQRLALFLIVLGPEAAAEVLKQFGDGEAELLCREMSQIPVVPEPVQRLILEEFSGLVARSAGSALGGLAYAQRTLGLAKGDGKASSIIGRLAPAGRPAQVIEHIGEMEGRQIFNLLRAEQPQTIAFVLSHLESAKAGEVFAFFSPEVREEVLERLGTIESTSLALVDKISQSLGRHIDQKVRPAFHQSGGVRTVAGLLKQLERNMTKSMLSRLDERNRALGAAVRKQMFSFEELARLGSTDMQRLLREIDTAVLATALKGASEPLQAKVMSALTKRAAEALKEEMELLVAARPKDIEASQDTIIQAVRKLEDEGQISLESDAAQPAA